MAANFANKQTPTTRAPVMMTSYRWKWRIDDVSLWKNN